MGDEIWLHHFESETKKQSMEWHHANSSEKKQFKTAFLAGKVLAIEGFISKLTYLQFFKIWIWAYQGIKNTLFDGIYYVFCWKRRKYQFQEPLKVRVISNVTHISAVFISKESYFVMAIYISTFSH